MFACLDMGWRRLLTGWFGVDWRAGVLRGGARRQATTFVSQMTRSRTCGRACGKNVGRSAKSQS